MSNFSIHINTSANPAEYHFSQGVVAGRDPVADPWPGDKWGWPQRMIDDCLENNPMRLAVYATDYEVRRVDGDRITLRFIDLGTGWYRDSIYSERGFVKTMNGYALKHDGLRQCNVEEIEATDEAE